MPEENKQLVRRYYEEVLNQRRLEVFDDLADPRFISHLGNGGIVDIGVYKQAIAASLAALPDLHVTIDDQIAEGDQVVTRWTATGTSQMEFAGIPPQGRPLTVTAIHIHRIQGGKLVEHWEAINLHSVKLG
jgi:predicted ester cyclase